MKTKDLNKYYFDITSYSAVINMPMHLIDDMIRHVMYFHHETAPNDDIKNASFIMAWNTLVHLNIYKKIQNA